MIGNWLKPERLHIKSRRWSSKMIPRVESVQYVGDYVVHVRFSDNTEGDLDLSDELYGEVFEPLKDSNYFRQVTVNRDIDTITWPNHADYSPDFLYEIGVEIGEREMPMVREDDAKYGKVEE